MNKIKTIALGLLVAMGMSSCEDTLYENVNPDAAHKNEAAQGLPVLVFYSQQVVYDHAEYYVYLSQCLTTTSKSQTGSYPYKSGWQFLTINRHPQWRRHFYDIGKNAKVLCENADEIDSPNYKLIARTIMLMSTQLTTDAFGDMPRTEAYQSNSPKYDTQASIYKWMFEEADELLSLYEDDAWVNDPNNQNIDQSMDRIYAGNLKMWKGLVYAIKARLLLRNIPNVNTSSSVCQEIIETAQKAIDTWRSGDLRYGSWFGNEPRYNFDGGTGESNAVWSDAQPIINSWESRKNLLTEAVPSKFFVQDLLGVVNPGSETNQGYWGNNGYGNDPRLMLLMVPQNGPTSPSNDATKLMIRFLENNIGVPSVNYKQAYYPNLYAGAYAAGVDAYNPLFTMEELYFIQAEAYYWMGNKTMACQLAKEASQWNIQRHLDRFLADKGAYPNSKCEASESQKTQESDKEFFERLVTNFLDNEASGRMKQVTQSGNQHWFFNPSEYTLSDLMQQKWIAMYMQPEQWTDMRRYHYSNKRNGYGIGSSNEIVYPTLRRPYNLYAAYWVDGLTDAEKEAAWMYRLNYDPECEEKYNRGELERLGAYKNHLWMREPMIWSMQPGQRTSLTAE
ncbi:MAG: SusD/RagB family nutrient-binding outer membrane lipoprotein [Bacteroidales bacterium]|nr:SusD/RagB family nutrient-binding outer membrane lipoprotein [Bacteroidales bacterium]